jgi:RHS repeat-associated protein
MALVARGEERYINERHITGGLPIVSQTSEGVQYHQHDHLGTTVASYSQDGTIISAYETTVFGQGELEDSRSARFTGKPYDADLGAYVFPFRNYDPESARWLSADPSGFPDGPNQHYYAAVPTMGVDPLGLVSYETVTGTGTFNQYDFYVQDFEFNYSFTYSESNGSTESGSVKSELSMTNSGIAVEVGIAVSQLNTSSVEVDTSWVDNGASSSLDQWVGGVTASQFVPTIPDGWAFDTWITSPVNNKTDLRDSGWENDTFANGAQWRSKGIFTDFDYAYSYQIMEL